MGWDGISNQCEEHNAEQRAQAAKIVAEAPAATAQVTKPWLNMTKPDSSLLVLEGRETRRRT
jgi:hypothetical protein